MNSTRVQSDLMARVEESQDQLEAEIRKVVHEIMRVATACWNTRAGREESWDRSCRGKAKSHCSSGKRTPCLHSSGRKTAPVPRLKFLCRVVDSPPSLPQPTALADSQACLWKGAVGLGLLCVRSAPQEQSDSCHSEVQCFQYTLGRADFLVRTWPDARGKAPA
jgi:hypothetical protein